MAKISVIGIIGASTFMTLDRFHEKGETAHATSLYIEYGGKGINQAVAAARLGAEVFFLGAVGQDSDGERCFGFTRENSVRALLKVKKGKPTTSAFILTDKTGENRVTVYRGAELDVGDVDEFEDAIGESDILLLQNEVPEEVNARAVELAKKHSVPVILNPAPARDISAFIAENIFLVTPNESESEKISPERFENVIVTLGEKGCLVNNTHFAAFPATPVDTTGAGDTFNGVLSVYLAEGKSLEEASRFASAASAVSVEGKGVISSLPTREQIERKMRNE